MQKQIEIHYIAVSPIKFLLERNSLVIACKLTELSNSQTRPAPQHFNLNSNSALFMNFLQTRKLSANICESSGIQIGL